jgi:hypothetical protein
MKIIQSFWTGNQNDFTNPHGWCDYKYNWISWILSSHQLVKFHKEVELYTDTFGYEILINKLHLPYTKVNIVLDELNHFHKDLWAVAKLKTFQLQTEPFLHVDGDVFVWESLTEKFKDSNLVVQNLEVTSTYYPEKWSQIRPKLVFVPDTLKNFKCTTTDLVTNMGIIGGNNFAFFCEYTQKSLEFVEKNRPIWSRIKDYNFNVFFEQIIFYRLAKQKNENISFLFNDTPNSGGYKGFADFGNVPQKKYLHLLGGYKQEIINCIQMENYTMKHFPETYSKLMRMINENTSNDNEVDFLNSEKVNEFENEFENELKNNNFSTSNFLIKRDLYNEGSQKKFRDCVESKSSFKLISIPCFEVKTETKKDQAIYHIMIRERNTESRRYNLDQIDGVMLQELSKPVDYDAFISKMKTYLSPNDSNEESINTFMTLINNRLQHYLTIRIISIYQL